MTNWRHRTLLLAAWLLLAPTAINAQEAADEAPAETPAQDAAKDDKAAQPAAPEPRSSSPFEYEASEEISDDLSVSFPVDI